MADPTALIHTSALASQTTPVTQLSADVQLSVSRLVGACCCRVSRWPMLQTPLPA